MAHFAKVIDGKVTKVIVADQEFIDNLVEVEAGLWVQTSYNTMGGVHYEQNSELSFETPSADQSKALRKNYAGIGYTYDETKDAFYAPQPYPSWTLNETTCRWEAPTAYPTDGQTYNWNEETTTWDLRTE
tara:strand:- start:45 stop:434 length:390 start_codon:yes stop_codon:yes gene_type:complete